MKYFAMKTFAGVAGATAVIFAVTPAVAQEAKLRVGLVLPAAGRHLTRRDCSHR